MSRKRSKYKLVGYDHSTHQCENCGRHGLDGTVVLEGPHGETLHFGADCACHAMKLLNVNRLRNKAKKLEKQNRRAAKLASEGAKAAPAKQDTAKSPAKAPDKPPAYSSLSVEQAATTGSGKRQRRMTGDEYLDYLEALDARPFPNPNPDFIPGETFNDRNLNYFMSGTNSPSEIQGSTGSNVGVSVRHLGKKKKKKSDPGKDELTITHLSKNAVKALHELRYGGGIKVFVDSGAFSEVEFPKEGGPPRVKKEITDEEWGKILDIYDDIATPPDSFEPWKDRQLYFVAPDCVGSQTTTAERLKRYKPRLKKLIDKKVNLIVPVQKGEKPMIEFADESAKIIGTDKVVWGVPMKKDATSLEEFKTFVDGLVKKGKPFRVHLLGLSPRSKSKDKAAAAENKKYDEAFAYVKKVSPLSEVFSDSVYIRSQVGRGKKPRRYTAAQDVARAEGYGKSDVKRVALSRIIREDDKKAVEESGWKDPELE